MLASLLRPRQPRLRVDRSPFSSPPTAQKQSSFIGRRKYSHYPDNNFQDDDQEEESTSHGEYEDGDEDEDEDGEQNEHNESTPLLPIFSAPHLG
jgi:hypothetical protein